ncbi:MAG: hypothetical protein H8E55_36735 [Pelagibacterales bacterium]|nr:hypothetical protein [Pelagibacterales bacterium]
MKKLLVIFSVLLLWTNVIADDENGSTKQKELEKKIQLLEKQLELEKLKKQLKEEKKKSSKKKKKTEKKTKVKKSEKKLSDNKKEKIINLINIKIAELGEFVEPSSYPKGLLETTAKQCNSNKFICIQDKAANEMSLRFKRTNKYNLRNPGNQIYAMALYEIYYLERLKKTKKKIIKFKEKWPEKLVEGKTAKSLISMNEGRKTMRNALGMTLETSIEDALLTYWTLADFLQRGEVKTKKIDQSLIKRQKLLARYKKAVGKLKRKIEKQELEEIYKYLEG